MELSLEKHFTKLYRTMLDKPAEVFALRGAVGVAIVHWLDSGWNVYLPGEPLVRRHWADYPEARQAIEALVVRVGGMLFAGRPLTHPNVSMSCGERGGPGKGRLVYRVRVGADQEVFDDANAAALRWMIAVAEYAETPAETPAEPYVRPLNKQDFDVHDEMNPDGTVRCTVYALRNGQGLRIAYWPSEGMYEAYDVNETLQYTGYFCAVEFDAAIDKLRQVAVQSLAAYHLPFKLDGATRRAVESPDGKRWTFASAENAQRYWLASIAGHIPPATTPEPAEPSAVPVESTDDEGGKKYDGGKPDYALLPPLAIDAMVRVLTYGAKKYGPDNWRKVPDLRRRYLSALLRHVFAHMRGETRDPETGENHLAHALCCVAFILELDEESATSGKA
jgi:hypothetical protein